MKKILIAAIAASFLSSPALADGKDDKPDPKSAFDIESPEINVHVDKFLIKDHKAPQDRIYKDDPRFFNVADIVQIGYGNEADVVQNAGTYDTHANRYYDHGYNNLNGSWTIQIGAHNYHWGGQSADFGAWNMLKVKQVGAYNTAYTTQYGIGYGQNLLGAEQVGFGNYLATYQEQYVSTNVLATTQIGALNAAYVNQYAIGVHRGGYNDIPAGNFGEVTQIGAGNKATLNQTNHR